MLAWTLAAVLSLAYASLAALGFLCAATFHPFRSFWAGAAVAAAALAAGAASAWLLARRTGLLARTRETCAAWPPRLGALAAPVGALAVLGAAVYLVLLGTHAVWRSRFDAFQVAAKARGLPVSLAEFQEEHPGDEYAYPALEKALEDVDLGPFKPGGRFKGYRFERWSPAVATAARAALAERAELIDGRLPEILRRRRRFERIDYRRWARHPSEFVDHGHRVSLISLGRMIALSAVDAGLRNEMPKAWDRLGSLFALSESVAQEPDLMHQMIALAMWHAAADAATTLIVNRPGLRVPGPITEKLVAARGAHFIRDGLRAEFALFMDKRSAAASSAIPERLLVLSGAVDAGFIELCSFLADAAARDGDIPDSEGERRIMGIPAWPSILGTIGIVKTEGLHVVEEDLKNWCRLALLAARLEAGYAGHGRYPATLRGVGGPGETARQGDLPLSYETVPGGTGYALCAAGHDGNRRDAHGVEFCIRRAG